MFISIESVLTEHFYYSDLGKPDTSERAEFIAQVCDKPCEDNLSLIYNEKGKCTYATLLLLFFPLPIFLSQSFIGYIIFQLRRFTFKIFCKAPLMQPVLYKLQQKPVFSVPNHINRTYWNYIFVYI